MQMEPQAEHQWLDKLVGKWVSEMECSMGPDQPPSKTRGTEVVRSLGGFWIVAEGEGEMPDGDTGTTIMTLGYDPQTQRYTGTFVGSMMAHMWIYSGALDEAKKALTLETEGPNFGETAMAPYKDTIELIDHDHRVMTSQILTNDGQWHQFMTAHYWRQ
ncbi:DUF1579 domain-containing protein [Nodosilinea sp. LEGE 07298]|uniref:DUF1579 domain-containing protein n=1 Tax=Nodosilinea sp. LEGE 07298 TaxID=2777970 RepID=UPI001882334A|nr:DUF1579 domain-containing protein [Nodosilinea sp. LEGE 07298]MBE9113019.1 DUF1579 domain-containing protein [Nodosilinea sp. LEGE 07298]